MQQADLGEGIPRKGTDTMCGQTAGQAGEHPLCMLWASVLVSVVNTMVKATHEIKCLIELMVSEG